MRRVTRDVDPSEARDLIERVPRACLCVADDRGPQTVPIVLLRRDGHYLVGVPTNVGGCPGPGQEVVVLVDEGIHWFDLRAVYIRGTAMQVEGPRERSEGLLWFEVVPQKTIAWDYGRLRQVRGES